VAGDGATPQALKTTEMSTNTATNDRAHRTVLVDRGVTTERA
jgi:hypothetical protein